MIVVPGVGCSIRNGNAEGGGGMLHSGSRDNACRIGDAASHCRILQFPDAEQFYDSYDD